LTVTQPPTYRAGELRSVSPFRYPGGKAFLSNYLAAKLQAVNTAPLHYAEPFCGGAGAAMVLLKSTVASHLHLNDADVRIYSAWRAMIKEPERFVDRVRTVPVDLATWHWASELISQSNLKGYDFDLGFATFFLNRTSRSGIVSGAGPIGGYNQTGKWKIGARFNAVALASRVNWLGSVADKITLTNEDGLTFLQRSQVRVPLQRTLFFIDPPYVQAGGRLYLNAMNEGKHIALSDILQNSKLHHWVLTYDDHPLIRSIYHGQEISDLAVTYSLQNKRKEREVLIEPTSR
jgi:DNA adenine methylase